MDTVMKYLRMLFDNFTLALLGVVLIATVLPCSGDGAVYFGWLTNLAIGLLFFLHGLRIMRLGTKFNRPIVTLIDTPGAFPGIEAEERGQAEAIARNLYEMSCLPVPIVCIVIGEGASGGALGIGVGDRLLMMENTWYSVISPESCSSILWKTWDNKEKAAEALKLAPEDLLELKIIDGIINEPAEGAHRNFDEAAAILKKSILKELKNLESIPVSELLTNRIEKYAQMGKWTESQDEPRNN